MGYALLAALWQLTGCKQRCAEQACLTVVESPAGPLDECDSLCVSVEVAGEPGAVRLVTEGGLVLGGERIAADGETVELCVQPALTGLRELRVEGCGGSCVSGGFEVDLRPFGFAMGLERTGEDVDIPPPVLGARPDAPVFVPEVGGWDAVGVLAPSVVEHEGSELLYYAGTDQDGKWADYAIGVASRSSSGGSFVRHADNPILVPVTSSAGDWDHYGQNTPEALARNGEVWLYYNGRAAEDGELSIGLATSPDGLSFEPHADNPVLSGSGMAGAFDERTVAHPSVVERDGFVELWFASGLHEVGYALSADGVTFERYCGGSVFAGLGEETWDLGRVKAPEVVHTDTGYAMTYSGCDKGCYQLGWAWSADGLRWTAAEEPLLGPGEPGTWDSQAVQEGFIQPVRDLWRIWYAGTDGAHQQVAVIDAEPAYAE